MSEIKTSEEATPTVGSGNIQLTGELSSPRSEDQESMEPTTKRTEEPKGPGRFRRGLFFLGRFLKHSLISLYQFLRPYLPTPNYFWCHVLYFAFMSLLGGVILWSQEEIDYIDALFVSTSAICQTGLSSVDFSTFSRSSQVMVMLWIVFGGLIVMSTVPLSIRLLLFLRKKKEKKTTGKNLDQLERIEIRVLTILLITIWSYIILVQLLAFISVGSYLEANQEAGRTVRRQDYSKWFWSLFHVISSFQNAGFALFFNSLIPFAGDTMISLTLALMTIVGYNLWPAVLHTILWIEWKLLRGKNKKALEVLLRNPRHFYYLLFPVRDTLRMLGGFLFITTLEWLIFFVEWNTTVGQVYTEKFSIAKKLMINFVQVIWVRNCGMNNVNIGGLEMGHLALLIVTMYISAFPFIVTVRGTIDDSSETHKKANPMKRIAKGLLSRDLLCLYCCIIVICLVEINRKSIDPTFVLSPYLAVVFEVSSAFGTVGLSVGFPGKNYSYSGGLHPFSKFIIILVFFCGRHRALPESVDSSVAITRVESFISDDNNKTQEV